MGAAPVWDLYRSFLAVAETGSFTAAARRLKTTQPTVGRQIAALEAQLGAALFTRSPRGLVLTSTGQEVVASAETMAAAAAAAERGSSAAAEGESGAVRLAAGDLGGVEVLPPILADFSQAHPRIEVELVLSAHNEDLLRGHADLAVRLARPTQRSLLARRLGSVRVGLFAHRRYVERFGLPLTLADLRLHRAIGFDRDFHVMRTSGPVAAAMRREDFGFRTDSVAAQLAALRAGIGITACQLPIARRDPDLIPVLENEMSFDREVWLVMHEDLRRLRRVRLLFEALDDGLSKYLRS